MHRRLRALFLLLALALHAATATDCNALLEIIPTSCSDVSTVCSAHSCNNSTGLFTCTAPIQCTGKLFKQQPLTRMPRCPSTLNLTMIDNCATAMKVFSDAGCTCSSCAFVDEEVEVRCSQPFQCSEVMLVKLMLVDSETSVDSGREYGMICGVYIAVAAALVAFAELFKRCVTPPFPNAEQPPELDESSGLLKKLWLFAVKKTITRFVDSDGHLPSFSRFVDKSSGLIQLASVDSHQYPPPHQQPFFYVRVAIGVVSTIAIAASFVILLGNVKFDSSCADHMRVHGKCSGADVDYSTLSEACKYGSIKYQNGARIIIFVVGWVANFAFTYAANAFPHGCKYQLMSVAVGGLSTAGLVVFALFYASGLADGDDAQSPLSQRPTVFIWHAVQAWFLGLLGFLATFCVNYCIIMTVPSEFIPHLRIAKQRMDWCPCEKLETDKRVTPSPEVVTTTSSPLDLHSVERDSPARLDAVVLETETGEKGE